MEFSLDRFYRLNRKAIIWIVLFGLIYLLRDFFTLIFLTFIISFFAFPASRYLSKRLGLHQALSVVLVYILIFVSYLALYVLVLPNVVRQAVSIRDRLPEFQQKLNEMRISYSEQYPNAAWLFDFDVVSTLSREEIRDWDRFSRRLLSDEQPSPRIRELLPPPVVTQLELLQQGENALTDRHSAPSTAGAPKPAPDSNRRPAAAPSTGVTNDVDSELEIADDLLRAINIYVIDNPYFFKPDAFPDLMEGLPENPELAKLLSDHEAGTLPERSVQKLNRLLLEYAYPASIRDRNFQTEQHINKLIGEVRQQLKEYLPNFALAMLKFFWTSLLAILFSFLIVIDYARLSREVRGLASSKFRDFFLEASQPVINFALSVGKGFQAIITIAFITTLMVIIALVILRIPSVAFLAVVAFVTSLVPVIGIFFEAVPILLVALNEHGPEGAFWALVAIAIIHFIIGYVVTPIIFGRQFKINLVAVIFILYIGNQLAGVWGMILGVPIANYFLREVFGVPESEDKTPLPQAPPVPANPEPPH